MIDKPEQVICVDDTGQSDQPVKGGEVVKGQIYTVREWRNCPSSNILGVLLVEVFAGVKPSGRYKGVEIAFLAQRFRPIKETDIDVFREMDKKIFNGEKIEA